MDHVGLNAAASKPPRQPEAVAAGFEGHNDALDLAAGFDRFVTPAIQQVKQTLGVRYQLLQRITVDTGNYSANQPTG